MRLIKPLPPRLEKPATRKELIDKLREIQQQAEELALNLTPILDKEIECQMDRIIKKHNGKVSG